MFNKLKKYFHKLKRVFLKHFSKPEIEFNKPLTSADVVKMFKDKNFYQLRKLMPQINFGRKKLSRWQSLGLVVMGVLGVALLPFHPLLALMALSLSFGSGAVFNSGNTQYTSSTALDSTHFVVAYQDHDNSDYGTAVVGTIDGSSISFGSEYVFNSGGTSQTSVTALDSTHFVVAYNDGGSSGYGTAVVGTVSGTTISYGSEYVFNGADTIYISAISLDSTHFVVAYEDKGNSYYGTAVVGTVSGTTISYGSEYVFNSATTQYISVTALDSTHFVVSYDDNGSSDYGTAVVGTVSGTTITFGSEYVFNSATTQYISVTALDSTHFVVAYKDVGNSSRGTAVVGTVSGTTISYGSEYVFNSGNTYYTLAISLDSTHCVVAYMDGGNSYYGTAVVGTIDGSSISFGSEYVFNSATAQFISGAALDSTHFVVAYQDGGNSSKGTTVVGTYAPPVVAPTVTTQAVTNIGTTTATGNGTITDDGGDTGATRGMCWNTSGTPTTADSHATNGTGEGAYTVAMTGLTAGTHYYVRAYSTNSAGTSYGDVVEFDTKTSGNGLFFGNNF